MFDENGVVTQDFRDTELKEILGDKFYNDPEKQQPTKMFDNVSDKKTFVNNYFEAQRKISAHGEEIKKATEGMTRIPGEGSSVEDVAAFREAIGVPKTKEEYNLPIPEKDKAGYEAVANAVRDVAHTVGIPASKLGTIWETVISALNKQSADLDQKGIDLLAADVAALKEKKKETYDGFMKDGEDALAKFDSGPEVAKLLDSYEIKGVPVIREFLFEVSKLVLPSKTHLGGGEREKVPAGGMPEYPDEYFDEVNSKK